MSVSASLDLHRSDTEVRRLEKQLEMIDSFGGMDNVLADYGIKPWEDDAHGMGMALIDQQIDEMDAEEDWYGDDGEYDGDDGGSDKGGSTCEVVMVVQVTRAKHLFSRVS